MSDYNQLLRKTMTVVTNACYNAALVLILTYDLVSLEIYKIKWKVYHNVGLSYARPEKEKQKAVKEAM